MISFCSDRIRRPLGGLIAALQVLLFAAFGVSAQEAPLDGLDEFIEVGMEAWRIPGLAVAVVKDDEVVYARGFGVRKLGQPEVVDANTVFGIGSVTKSFTAAAVGMLVDEGRLDWDDPVVGHMPTFLLSDRVATQQVTARDLLSHRVGVGRMVGNRLQFLTNRDRDEILYRMRYHEFERSFRSGYVYSNIMYTAAGQLIPAIVQVSWDEFIEQRIFRTLGMTASNTSIFDITDEENAAWPHADIEGEIQTIPRRSIDNIGPAGSINSTVTEMAEWIRLHLGEPGSHEGRQLLRPEVMREMHSAQVALPATEMFGSLRAYGLGWSLRAHAGRMVSQHGGGVDGMNASLAIVPAEELGIVVLSNLSNGLIGAIVNTIIDSYVGRPAYDWNAAALESVAERQTRVHELRTGIHSDRVRNTEPSLSLERYVGIYGDSLYSEVEVKVGDDGLELHFWEDSSLVADLEHWHYDTFRATWRNAYQGEKFVFFRQHPLRQEVAELHVEFILRPPPADYTRVVQFRRMEP